MKPDAKLKNLFAKSFFALSLLPVSSELPARTNTAVNYKDFRITIEKTETGIKMESLKGSAWIKLSFNTVNDKPQAIDEYGMTKLNEVSATKDPTLADFLFTVTKTKDGILLKGIEGSAWTELRFTLPQNGKQTINQFGMIR